MVDCLNTDLAAKAVDWLKATQSLTPDKPFRMYSSCSASHPPSVAWLKNDLYKGKFDLSACRGTSGAYFLANGTEFSAQASRASSFGERRAEIVRSFQEIDCPGATCSA